MKAYVESFLDSSLSHLKNVFPAYEIYYINATGPVPGSSEDEAVELPYLVCPLFDLVSNVVRGGRAKKWLDPENQSQNLTNLVGVIFQFAQMTAEDVGIFHSVVLGSALMELAQADTWATNANAFVAQEEDETEAYGVRVAGFGLLNVRDHHLPLLH